MFNFGIKYTWRMSDTRTSIDFEGPYATCTLAQEFNLSLEDVWEPAPIARRTDYLHVVRDLPNIF